MANMRLFPVLPILMFSRIHWYFLAEIILMGNPDKLFSQSKLFMFCGGSVFSNMNGSSKLIMDSQAFDHQK